MMENDPRFCVSYKPECAVWHRDTTCKVTREASDALVAKTLFAIQTCKDHHDLRLPTVHETWAPAAQNIIYVSEVVDPKYGTVVLPGNIINLTSGIFQHQKKLKESILTN